METQMQDGAHKYCSECLDVFTDLHPQERECPVCGTLLVTLNRNREAPTSAASFSSSDGSPTLAEAVLGQAPIGGHIESLLARLLQQVGGLGDREENHGRKGLTEQDIEGLNTLVVDDRSYVLHNVTVTYAGVQFEAVPSAFAPLPPASLQAPMVQASPTRADDELTNPEMDVRGGILLCDRGGCSFVEKARRAQAAGAVACIVIQCFEVWPYVMTDSTGSAQDDCIPCIMLSQPNGASLRALMNSTPSQPCQIVCGSSNCECIICASTFDAGAEIIRLSCSHYFHKTCLGSWLKINNSCPLCRLDALKKDGPQGQGRAQDDQPPLGFYL